MKIIASVISLILILPLMALPSRGAFSYNETFSHIVNTVLSHYVSNTLMLLVLTCFWASLWGVGTAYILSSFKIAKRSLLKVAMMLPFACPGYLLGYYFVDTFQFTFSTRNIFWASFVMGISLYPYVYMSCLAGFSVSLMELLTGFSGSQQSHSSIEVCIAIRIADSSRLIVELLIPSSALSSRYFAKSDVLNSVRILLQTPCLNMTLYLERSLFLSALFFIISLKIFNFII